MKRALDGLLVVAIEQAVAAPMCTVRLADAGARVIKIERPGGETARHYDEAVMGTSAYFAWLNRGKESVVLDLKGAADVELMHRLIAQADVLVQNLAPGATGRLGIGSRDMVLRYPRLIAVDIVGYGQDTAYRDKRAYDMLVQAESGLCAVTGTPDTPSKVGVSVADIATGLSAHALVLEALLERAVTGTGKAIEVAMFDVMADWMSVPLLHQLYAGVETGRYGLAHASIYPYKPYPCRDGEVILAIQNADEWRRFCSGVMQRPDLREDPRFIDNPSRVRNREALDGEISGVFSTLSVAELVQRLEAHQIAWGKVSTVSDLVTHPALRRMAVKLHGGETFEIPRPAGRPELRAGPPPDTGADTSRIREEFRA